MIKSSRIGLILLAGILAVPAATASAGAAPVAEAAQPAKLPTDGEVRHAMSEVRQRLAEALPALRGGTLDAGGRARLADAIGDQLQKVSANTRLPDDVRARLAQVVASLRTATASVRTQGADGLAPMLAALDSYGRTFDHPGWEDGRLNGDGR
ncbi:MAG: hypothetical protein ACM3Q1_05135 [Bacteroidales bacterium]